MGEKAASDLLKLFINGNETTDVQCLTTTVLTAIIYLLYMYVKNRQVAENIKLKSAIKI